MLDRMNTCGVPSVVRALGVMSGGQIGGEPSPWWDCVSTPNIKVVQNRLIFLGFMPAVSQQGQSNANGVWGCASQQALNASRQTFQQLLQGDGQGQLRKCGGPAPYVSGCAGGGSPPQCTPTTCPDPRACVNNVCVLPPTPAPQHHGTSWMQNGPPHQVPQGASTFVGAAPKYCPKCVMSQVARAVGVVSGAARSKGQVGKILETCVPRTCADMKAACGWITEDCGSNIYCGKCMSGACNSNHTCGDGDPEQTCVPKTCADRGVTCGQAFNGCGGVIDCGTCPDGYACGADSQCYQLPPPPPITLATPSTPPALKLPSPPPCVPKTCADLGTTCGQTPDGCGGAMDCGTCPGGYYCRADNKCAQRPEVMPRPRPRPINQSTNEFAPTGMSTGSKVAIGAGVVGLGVLGWLVLR